MARHYNLDNPLWLKDARGIRVAVFVGNDAPFFANLIDWCDDNCDALDDMTNNADGHDAAYRLLDGDDLMLGGGAAPIVRVTCAVKCPSCGVEAVEWAELDGCEDLLCEGQAKGREIERLCMGASA